MQFPFDGSTMNRRTFLGLGATTVALGLAGCTVLGDRQAADPLYPDDRDVPAGTATHDLYVENYEGTAHTVALTVVRASDDALVWRNTYEALGERGFSIPDLLVTGRTYEITADVTDVGRSSSSQSIEECPHGGSRNVGVWIGHGGTPVAFRQDNCDEIRVGADLSYGDHEQFVVD